MCKMNFIDAVSFRLYKLIVYWLHRDKGAVYTVSSITLEECNKQSTTVPQIHYNRSLKTRSAVLLAVFLDSFLASIYVQEPFVLLTSVMILFAIKRHLNLIHYRFQVAFLDDNRLYQLSLCCHINNLQMTFPLTSAGHLYILTPFLSFLSTSILCPPITLISFIFPLKAPACSIRHLPGCPAAAALWPATLMVRPQGSGQVSGPQSAAFITPLTTAEQPIYRRVTTEPINLLACTATARKLDAGGR